jgi:NAD(P)-dependent dehydrogenase (short-subunit alcohol dehydrogenase family)
MTDTLLWITGATEGIGLGLARNQPFGDARIINLSRRPHPDYESVHLDLTDPATWPGVQSHIEDELRRFSGRRVLFVQNGYYSQGVGLLAKVAADRYQNSVIANLAAPLVLARTFLAACPPDIDAGLVLLSSGAAVAPLEGLASYCASKVALEHWAEVAVRERESAGGRGPWVVAVRPGGVDTAPVRALADWDPALYPRARQIRDNIVNRLDIDSAAKRIWAELPPPPGVAVISFAKPPSEPNFRFGGERIRTVPSKDWRLVYATAQAPD